MFQKILLASVLVLFPLGSFAASGVTSSGSTATGASIKKIEAPILIETKEDTEETEKKAQKLILEVYKLQGNKILKEIDQSLEKMNLDTKAKKEAYASIQKTLELRKQKIEKSDMSSDAQDIIISYIDHMVSMLSIRKSGLE